MQPLVGGRMREGVVDPCQRLARRAGGQPVGDEHHLRRHRAGVLGDHALGHRHRRGARLAALAEVDGGLQRPRPGIGGRQRVGFDRGERAGVEVAGFERQRGQRQLAFEVLRILLDEALQLAQRPAGVAAVAQQPGIGEPRRGMRLVEPEDVAELERRPRRVALGEQRQRPLVVRLGLLGRGVAGAERQQGGEQEARPEGAGAEAGPGDGAGRTQGKARPPRPGTGTGRIGHSGSRGWGAGRARGPRRAREHRASRPGPEAAIA